MKKNKTISSNYLDFIPVLSEKFHSETDEAGAVTIFVENKGLFHKLAQKFLHKPAISQIHLDEMGSFIWSLIDGNTTIYNIAQKVKEHFGDEAEPLYNRLVQYIRNLESYGFIDVKKTEKNPDL